MSYKLLPRLVAAEPRSEAAEHCSRPAPEDPAKINHSGPITLLDIGNRLKIERFVTRARPYATRFLSVKPYPPETLASAREFLEIDKIAEREFVRTSSANP